MKYFLQILLIALFSLISSAMAQTGGGEQQVKLPFQMVQPPDAVLVMQQYVPMTTSDFGLFQNVGRLETYFYHTPANTVPSELLTSYKDYLSPLGFIQDKEAKIISFDTLYEKFKFQPRLKDGGSFSYGSTDQVMAVFKKPSDDGQIVVSLWAGQAKDDGAFSIPSESQKFIKAKDMAYGTGDNFLLINISWPVTKMKNSLVNAAPPVTQAQKPVPPPVAPAPVQTPSPETAEVISKELKEHGKVNIYGLLFDFNKADLKPESAPVLNALAETLQKDPAMNILIVGHTDNVGGADYNQKLSMARAQNVAKALETNYGITASRLTSAGKGLSEPIASNDTEEGRAKNRRVEFKVVQ